MWSIFKAKGKFQQVYNTIKNDLLSHSSIINCYVAEDRLLTNKTSATTNLYWEGKDDKDVHAEILLCGLQLLWDA